MARIVQQSINSAHGSIDLIVEDAFGDQSHHSIHVGSAKQCPECGHLGPHEGLGIADVKDSKRALLEWMGKITQAKIDAFEAHGFDMAPAKAKLQAMQSEDQTTLSDIPSADGPGGNA